MMEKKPSPDSQPGRSEEERSFEHGSSGANADAAVTGSPEPDEASLDAPYARPAPPIAADEKPDELAERQR